MLKRKRRSSVPAASLADQAHAALGEAIRTRQLAPGELLSEGKLAQRLGMSRTPVREALRRLEQEGLVVTRAGVGTLVGELTMVDIHEICETLAALDTAVAGWAAERGSDDVLASLLVCARTMEAAAQARDRTSWGTADNRFHELLTEAAANRTVRAIVTTLRGRLRRISLNSATRQDRLLACTEEHLRVAEAIAARQPEEARARMRAHLQAMRHSIVSMLEQYVVPVVGERF